ncbi:MAG: tetratricopeptide repeat protein [Bacilli bacterium]
MAQSEGIAVTSAVDIGKELLARGLPYAAVERLERALAAERDPEASAMLANALGWCFTDLGDPERAAGAFTRSRDIARAGCLPDIFAIRPQINLALTELRRGNPMKAYEEAIELLGDVKEQPEETQGLIYVNLAAVCVALERYDEAEIFASSGAVFLDGGAGGFAFGAYVNLGVALLALGDPAAARQAFEVAYDRSDGQSFHAALELLRLHLLRGDEQQLGAMLLRCALDGVWTQLIEFSRDDLGRICEVLGYGAAMAGDSLLADRLLEKAELYFGRVGCWREYRALGRERERRQQSLTFGATAAGRSEWPDALPTARMLHAFLGALDTLEQIAPTYFAKSQQVARLAVQIGDALGFPTESLRAAYIGAQLLGWRVDANMRTDEREALIGAYGQIEPGWLRAHGFSDQVLAMAAYGETFDQDEGLRGFSSQKLQSEPSFATAAIWAVVQTAERYIHHVRTDERHSSAMRRLDRDPGAWRSAVCALRALERSAVAVEGRRGSRKGRTPASCS